MLSLFNYFVLLPDECDDSKIEVSFESSPILELVTKHIYGIFTKKRTLDGTIVFQHDDIIDAEGRLKSVNYGIWKCEKRWCLDHLSKFGTCKCIAFKEELELDCLTSHEDWKWVYKTAFFSDFAGKKLGVEKYGSHCLNIFLIHCGAFISVQPILHTKATVTRSCGG